MIGVIKKLFTGLMLLPILGFSNINIGGVINDYAKVTSISFPNCNDICDTARNCLNAIEINNASAFQKGDKALIIQMKGATINTSNTALGGSITNIGNAGNYEFITIRDIVGNTVYPLRQLTKDYDVPGLVQLVRIPNYNDDVTVVSTLEALPWNPTTGLGGVLALFVNGDLTLNANLSVEGMGYIGEEVNVNGSPDNCSRNPNNQFVGPATNTDMSPKGNGIVVNDPTTNGGRAPRANGGGGGVSGDSGGGGGSNYGAGGDGGNRWCDYNTEAGGKGGWPLQPYLPLNKVFLGGAGGPGFVTNNNSAEAANGGGIIVVKANQLIANGYEINASGTSPSAPGSGIDGGGGGGAGGTVALSVDAVTGNLNVNISGGDGQSLTTHVLHGPGGGGGGGALLHNLGTFPPNVNVNFSGGNRGVHGGSNAGVDNGSEDGEDGGIVYLSNIIRDYEIGSVSNTNAVCGCNATIEFAGFYSTGEMSYSIDEGLNYQSSPTFSDVCPGTHKVQAVDESGCIYDTTLVVLNNAYSIDIDLGPDKNICDGNSALIGLTAVDSLDYVWSSGETTSEISKSSAGEFVLTVTDDNTCEGKDTIEIFVHNPNVQLPEDEEICFNELPFEISPTSISAGVSFLWNDGATTQDNSVHSSGTFTLQVTDAYGCTNDDAFVLTVNNLPTVDLGNDTVICFNTNTEIGVNNEVGYTYAWDNGPTTSTQTVNIAGDYTLQITDANGCVNSDVITIGVKSDIAVNLSANDVICNGGNNGSISSVVSGGGSTYSYLWSNGATTQNISGLTASTYSVTVTDELGCSTTESIDIEEPTALTASTTQNNVLCYGGTGDVSIVTNGGTGSVSYLWSDGQTTATAANLLAGTYTVTATDENGCTVNESVTITEPTVLSLSLSTTNASCFSENGTITSLVAGGTGAYTYAWDNGATTADLNAGAGNYTLTVTDENNCTVDASATITEPNELLVNLSTVHPNCNSGNGTLSSTVAGGTSPYTYSWDNGAATENITAAAGTYELTVTDANGCVEIASSTITEPTALTASTTQNNVLCYGGTGDASIVTNGRTGAVSYLWSDGQTTATAANLLAGTYTVTATDENGCTVNESVTITEPTVLSLSLSTTNASCFSENGTITSSVAGGTGAYTYAWDNGASTADLNAGAGNYTLTVTDENNCTVDASATITEPDNLSYSVSVFDASCFEGFGGAQLNVVGGTGVKTINWENGQTGDLVNVQAATYVFTITDENNCTLTDSVQINEPTELSMNLSVNNAACNGRSGTATVTVFGGTQNYIIEWDGIVGGYYSDSLTVGAHNVIITDANGCEIDSVFEINQPNELIVDLTADSVVCFGENNGAVISNVSGGTPGYSYLWSNGVASANLSNVQSGVYSVNVTDANNCTASSSVTVNQPNILIGNMIASDVSCNGDNSGSATVDMSGGTTPYNYSWSNGAAIASNTNLTAATYNLLVVDDNGCTWDTIVSINEPEELEVSASSDSVLCNGAADGTGKVQVSGGTSPYVYSWENGATDSIVNNLTVGDYTVTVSDANGCSEIVSVTIPEPTALSAILNAKPVSCYGNANGELTSAVMGGTKPYTYLWSNGSQNANLTNLAIGEYEVVITDRNGCTINKISEIMGPDSMVIETQSESTYCDLPLGQASASVVEGGTPPYTYEWEVGQNSIINDTIKNLFKGSYTVVVTDFNGCVKTSSANVMDVSFGGITKDGFKNVSCYGLSDGEAKVSFTGQAKAPYTFEWTNISDGSTLYINDSLAAGLFAGSYMVSMTDSNGCVFNSDTFNITEPEPLLMNEEVNDEKCYQSCDGNIVLNVQGGTLPYAYSWNKNYIGNTGTASNLCYGDYNVTVEDANGCQISNFFQIASPDKLEVSLTTYDEHCHLGDGKIESEVIGGVLPYSYEWNTGDTTPQLQFLSAGSYHVTVRDGNDCEAPESEIIISTLPPSMDLIQHQNVSCFGKCDGLLEVKLEGALGSITYSWEHGNSNSPLASNLCVGDYKVIGVDEFGCKDSLTLDITEPELLTVQFNTTHPLCFNSCDGAINAQVQGGASPYRYTWKNGVDTISSDSAILNNCAGIYNLTVTDSNNCKVNSSSELINPQKVTAVLSAIDVSCYNACDGEVEAVASPIDGTYTYNWTGPNNLYGASQNGLCEGWYTLNLSNANGCLFVDSVEVKQPDSLQITANINNVSCKGLTNGSVETFVSGGNGNYTYSWDNGVTTANLLGVEAGTYVLTVDDAKGCSKSVSFTVEEPDSLIGTLQIADATCFQACNGTATANIVGGTSPYLFQWVGVGGADTNAIDSLCASSYSVMVTDAQGCIWEDSFSINQPNALNISTTQNDANCSQSNGEIQLNVAGGSSGYTYFWENGATTSSLSNVTAGCYGLSVTDANNCVLDTILCLNNISGPEITVTDTNDVQCFAGSDGAFKYNISGGEGVITSWVIQGNDTLITNLNEVTGLTVGCYEIIAQDSAGCLASQSVCIEQPTALNAVVNQTNNISCFNACDGQLEVLPFGGTTPYSYLWSNGSTISTAENVCSGESFVKVTDSNNCLVEKVITVNQPTLLQVSGIEITDVQCYNGVDGALTASITGGTQPYDYSWSNGVTNAKNSGLAEGSYTVIVTDANGCIDSASAMVNQPDSLKMNYNSTPITCGKCNGTAEITTVGGSGSYTYNWFGNGNQNLKAKNDGLCEGIFPVEVMDDNGCLAQINIEVQAQELPLIDTLITTNARCFDSNDGNIVPVVNAVGPVTFLWDNKGRVVMDSILTNVGVGNYCLTVIDANGCKVSECTNLDFPTPVTVNFQADTKMCYGNSNQIWLNASGGVPNYTFSWDNDDFIGAGPHNLNAEENKTYCFKAIDANGCTSEKQCIETDVSLPIKLWTNGDKVICTGQSVGVFGYVTGGNGEDLDVKVYSTAPYTGEVMQSSLEDNKIIFTDLPDSTATYYIVASDGCSADLVDTVKVLVNVTPEVTMYPNDSSGCAPFTMPFQIETNIPNPTYEFDFDGDGEIDYTGGNSSPVHTYNKPGVYQVAVNVISPDSCSTTVSTVGYVIVHKVPEVSFKIKGNQEPSTSLPEVNFEADYKNGKKFSWNFGDGDSISGYENDWILTEERTRNQIQTPVHVYQDSGWYNVNLVLESRSGCIAQYQLPLYIQPAFRFYAPNSFTPNGDGINEFFKPVGIGWKYEDYEFQIWDRWGELIFQSNDRHASWDGTYMGREVQTDTYVWKVTVRDVVENKLHEFVGHVSLIR